MEPSDFYRSTPIMGADDNLYFVVTDAEEWDKHQLWCTNYPYSEVLPLLRPDLGSHVYEYTENVIVCERNSAEEIVTVLDSHGFVHNADLDKMLNEYLDEWL